MAADPIFEAFHSGALNLANRLVALPVFTGYATVDGRVSPLLKSHYQRLAYSGVGLVMVANVAVRADGITSRCNLRLDDDRYIAGLADLARVVHRGGALAGLQLNHAGRLALTDQPLSPAPMDGANLAFNIASLKRFMEFFPLPARFALTRRFLRQAGAWRNAMSIEACQEVIEAFARAANRAATAGFDLVEIHGASGYLVCQFLSAFTNPPATPDDLVRHLAFPLTLFKRVRDELKPGVPLGWRLMVREFVPDGIDVDQAKALGRELARAGAAYVSVSAGTFHSLFADQVQRVTRSPGYLGSDCAELRDALRIPVVAAGRIITPAVARRMIASGQADLIGLGRPLQADTGWPHKARQGRRVRVCLDCNRCLRRVVLDQGLGCVRWSRRRLERIELTRRAMDRLGSWLWIVAAPGDIRRYRELAPILDLGMADEPAASPATVLFLDPAIDGHSRSGFLRWVSDDFSPGARQATLAMTPGGKQADALVDLVRREAFGGAVFCRDSAADLDRRLVYRPRRKVVTLLGRAAWDGPVLVPLDFSDAGLLQLFLVRRMLARKPDLDIDLVHVYQQSALEAQRRWTAVRRLTDWPATVALDIVAARGGVAATLIARARERKIHTVIMGKRGLSGVKRLLLGSVSAAVVAGLPDATVVLVD